MWPSTSTSLRSFNFCEGVRWGAGVIDVCIVTATNYVVQEGVMVAEKDFHAPKHPELEAIPNLQVFQAATLMSLNYDDTHGITV